MKKSMVIAFVLAAFIFGMATGSGSMYYAKVIKPIRENEMIAKRQQEEMNKMVRQGKVLEITADSVTVQVEKGGGDVGQAITAKVNKYTSVQVGMDFINQPGEQVDLNSWFKKGDSINTLMKDGQALVLHREQSPGEQLPTVLEKLEK